MTVEIEAFKEMANLIITQALREAYYACEDLKKAVNADPPMPFPRLRAFKSPAGEIRVDLFEHLSGYKKPELWIGEQVIVYDRECREGTAWLHGGYDPVYIKRMVEMLRAYARYLRKRTEGVYRARAEYLRQKSRAVEWIEGEATLIRLAKEGQ